MVTIGRSINSESKAIECLAQIEDVNMVHPVNKQFTEGQVVVDSVSALSVNAEAVMKSGEENYVLCLDREGEDKYYFNKVKIKPGKRNNDHVEITGTSLPSKYISSGIYNLRLE